MRMPIFYYMLEETAKNMRKILRILMPSLPQSLFLRLIVLRVHPAELEDRDMDQDETPIIQWEIVSDYYTIQMLTSL